MNSSVDGMKNSLSPPNAFVTTFGGNEISSVQGLFNVIMMLFLIIYLFLLYLNLVNGNMVKALTEQAPKLLDFSQKLDISLLDNVVNCMYGGEGQQQRLAQEILTSLKEHPEAWTRVDTILEFSHNQETKYYALQILENLIKTRWKVLPENQCEGIKKFIVGLIIKTSSDRTSLESEKVYLNKLNMILVQVSVI